MTPRAIDQRTRRKAWYASRKGSPFAPTTRISSSVVVGLRLRKRCFSGLVGTPGGEDTRKWPAAANQGQRVAVYVPSTLPMPKSSGIVPLRVNVTWLSSMDTISSVPPTKLPPPPSHESGASSGGLVSPNVLLVLSVRSMTVPACWLSVGRPTVTSQLPQSPLLKGQVQETGLPTVRKSVPTSGPPLELLPEVPEL